MQKQYAIIVDVLLTVLFIIIGRASHSESLMPTQVMVTAWPFILALCIGWVILLARKRDHMAVSTGIFVWLVTWIGGLSLRVAGGDTAATAFIIVAGITLLLFLVGWRVIAFRLGKHKRASVSA